MVKDKIYQTDFLAFSIFNFIVHILTDIKYAAINHLTREMRHGKR